MTRAIGCATDGKKYYTITAKRLHDSHKPASFSNDMRNCLAIVCINFFGCCYEDLFLYKLLLCSEDAFTEKGLKLKMITDISTQRMYSMRIFLVINYELNT